MTVFVDTNVLVRHFTGEPPEQAARAAAALRGNETLILVDLVLAELIYVLQSVYRLDRARVAQCARSILTYALIKVDDRQLLLRTIEVYETHSLHFVEAYLVASAEESSHSSCYVL